MKRSLLLLILVLLPLSVLAQVANYTPLYNPKSSFLDQSGRPLAGGKLYTYAAGTSTPIATYTDSTGAISNSNPVILDAGGMANIWLGPSSYKLRLTTAKDVGVWTMDGVSGGKFVSGAAADASLVHKTGDEAIAGNKTFTGTLTTAIPGAYTNTSMSFGLKATVGAVTPETLFHGSQGVDKYGSEALTGTITVPTGGTVYQADAVAGYALDNSGVTKTVALYGYAQCNIGAGQCWGVNPAATAANGTNGVIIQGAEVDLNTYGTNTTIYGVSVAGFYWRNPPALASAFNCSTGGRDEPVTQKRKWTTCFQTQAGASDVAFRVSPAALQVNPATEATSPVQSNSQTIELHAVQMTTLTDLKSSIYGDIVGALHLSPAQKQDGSWGNLQLDHGGIYIPGNAAIALGSVGCG